MPSAWLIQAFSVGGYFSDFHLIEKSLAIKLLFSQQLQLRAGWRLYGVFQKT